VVQDRGLWELSQGGLPGGDALKEIVVGRPRECQEQHTFMSHSAPVSRNGHFTVAECGVTGEGAGTEGLLRCSAPTP
jgi:hypothetical protein